MSKEVDMSTRVHIGVASLTVGEGVAQTYQVYQLPPEFPSDPAERDECFDHIREGAATELMTDFELGGVHYPEADKPQEMTTKLSCEGVSCILKRCGLKIEQFDENGQLITEMKSVF